MAWKSREAMLAYNREYYAKNKEEMLAKQRARIAANPELFAARYRESYLKRKEKAKAERQARYQRNRDLERKQQAAYRAANLDAIREQQRQYRAEHREELARKAAARRLGSLEQSRAKDRARRSSPEERAKVVARVKEWVRNNRDRSRAWHRQRRKERLASDPAYRARIAIRRRFYMAIRNQVYDGWVIRSGEAVRLLGCTMPEFVRHIESLWTDGMSWSNWTRDGWHIDHIIPLSAFDLSDEEQIKAACHYTNLRPLWAADNLSKGSRTDVVLTGKGTA